MNVHVKISRKERVEIAKAIFSGASYQEVSAEYGISTAAVMSAVETVRRAIARNAKSIQMDSKKKPQLTVWPLQSAVGRELGLFAARKGIEPSMPYVSLLDEDRA